MVRIDLLRGVIAQRGLSQKDVADELGIVPKTFYSKMKKGVFDSDEINEMIRLLKIDGATAAQIFFDIDVT